MAARKRTRAEKTDASRLKSTHDNSSTTSVSKSAFGVASKRVRKSASIDKILNIVELCEQVLSHIPMNDLLHATQICRGFKTTIENSSLLQKKLFLAPDLARKNRTAISSKRTLLSGAKAAQHIAAAEAAGEDDTGEVIFYIPHPAIKLREREINFKHPGLVSYAVCRVKLEFHSGEGAIRASVLSSADIRSQKSTSLENMFLTQPPITRVKVSEGQGYMPWDKKQQVLVNTGVKFRDVFKAMRALRADRVPHIITFYEGIVASAKTRDLAENADELTVKDDPTRWVLKQNGEVVLKEGGFEFL